MATEKKVSEEEAARKLREFVVQQMKAGRDKEAITQKLAEMGMDRAAASAVVEAMHAAVLEQAQREQFSSSAILPGLLGGLGAALLGGGIWAAIVIATDYEIGYMATGIGVLAGYAVVLFAHRQKGTALQIVAVLSALLGIAVGKYVALYYVLAKLVGERQGTNAAGQMSIFSAGVFEFFVQHVGSLVSGFDLLWVVLAVVAAWRIPRAIGVPLPDYMKTR